MKNKLYIAALTLLAVLVSCQRENFESVRQSEDGFLEVTFPVSFASPSLAPSTRAKMGEGPTTADFNLYVCVYGPGDGFVQNWIKAKILNLVEENGFIVRGTYKVMLPLADDQRTLHLFVNPPAAANPTLTDYIDNVMERMVDTEKDCSYWQEVILDEISDSESVEKLTGGVNMVRNFAKIIVDTADDQPFEVLQWALLNTPDRGYVAPYNPTNKYVVSGSTTDRFPSGYLNENVLALANATDGSLFTQLSGRESGQDNYPVYLPAGAELIGDVDRTQEEFDDYPGEPADGNTNYVLAGAPLYMYERPVPESTERPTAVLVQIRFDEEAEPDADPEDLTDDHTYWYKVEVLDTEGGYIPIYRDIVYRMNIADIEEVGSKTAFDAFKGEYFGNISASVETANLTDLSNKTSQIHVDQLDYTFVHVPESGKQLLMLTEDQAARFYFIPNLENPDAVYVKDAPGVCTVSVSLLPDAGYEPALTAIEANGESGDGTIVVTFAAQEEGKVKKSIIRVTGKAQAGQQIYREITVTLMDTPHFVNGTNQTSVATPDGYQAAGLDVNFRIWLPKDLGPSLFPIQVCIEAEQNTLSSTTPDLPVLNGPSAFDPSRNTFYYVRTIKYSEYCFLNNNKKWTYNYFFDCTLKTNHPTDNSTRIRISEMNGKFIPVEYLAIGTADPNPEP